MAIRNTKPWLMLAMVWGVSAIIVTSIFLMLFRIHSAQAWSGVVLLLLAEFCLIVVYVISKLTIWIGRV